jgi:deoxyadenosine/deoxycytidine kinase
MKRIFTIEGNIGSGKSTIFELLKNKLNNFNNFIFLPEPVDEWNTITDSDGITIIEKYYSDQKKYAFSFQMMAYITRLTQIKDCLNSIPDNTIVITERCVFTDLNVFAKMLHDSHLIEDIEFSIYTKWFYELLNMINFQLTGLIYIKTTPSVCLDRIRSRNRKGEHSITIDYLNSCHEYHENWITFENVSKLIINGNGELNENTINTITDFLKSF